MKKLLAKISLFTIISLVLISAGSVQTFADTATTDPKAQELSQALNDVQQYSQWCIQETDQTGTKPGPDDKYIITIVEEPLSLEQTSVTTKDGVEFESRICYRNYFAYTPTGKSEKLISILSKICSSDITDNKYMTSDYKDYNIKAYCQPVQVYLSKGGTALLTGYLSAIYKWAAGVVGVIAVTVIIISAIQISISGGDTQAVDTAKGRIMKSLAGIAVLFLSGLILYTINPTFFTK